MWHAADVLPAEPVSGRALLLPSYQLEHSFRGSTKALGGGEEGEEENVPPDSSPMLQRKVGSKLVKLTCCGCKISYNTKLLYAVTLFKFFSFFF